MSIQTTDLTPGYPILEINHPAATARVTLHGAHLLDWTPTGHAPVLYLSPQAIFQAGKPIRGGVPICWPWFGAHPTDATLPAHGFVRNLPWQLAAATEDAEGVTLRFTLTDDAETRKFWPQGFQVAMIMRIGATLELALHMKNTAAQPVTITGALHTYFAVGDVTKAFVSGLDGKDYLDVVGPPTQRTQQGNIHFDQEVDRVYATTHEIQLNDPSLARTIIVRGTGSRCSVVWNPWIAKAQRLADLPDEDYLRFVCVETANAGADRIMLAPGAVHTLATQVRVATN